MFWEKEIAMPRMLRCEIFDSSEVSIVHCVQRCVRRAYLAGMDAVSGKNYEFRREWIRARMERLASVFGVDVLTYSILSNHLHLVLRTRPDVIATWSDEEVAIRWLKVFPGRRLDELLAEPTQTDVETLVANKERMAIVKARLSDPSWFMRALSEPIARLANKQDECTGRFWEGRFKAQRITDDAGLLACSMYVDLNPIRAAMAESPEQSLHTSAYDRINAIKGATILSAAADLTVITREDAAETIKSSTPDQLKQRRRKSKLRRGMSILRDAWLAPMTLMNNVKDPVQASSTSLRASDRGFLSMKLTEYLALLDWTGREGHPSKRGKIPDELAPILTRLGIDGHMWCDLVWGFKKYFGKSSSAGSPKSMKESAAKYRCKFARGQNAAAGCFASALVR